VLLRSAAQQAPRRPRISRTFDWLSRSALGDRSQCLQSQLRGKGALRAERPNRHRASGCSCPGRALCFAARDPQPERERESRRAQRYTRTLRLPRPLRACSRATQQRSIALASERKCVVVSQDDRVRLRLAVGSWRALRVSGCIAPPVRALSQRWRQRIRDESAQARLRHSACTRRSGSLSVWTAPDKRRGPACSERSGASGR